MNTLNQNNNLHDTHATPFTSYGKWVPSLKKKQNHVGLKCKDKDCHCGCELTTLKYNKVKKYVNENGSHNLLELWTELDQPLLIKPLRTKVVGSDNVLFYNMGDNFYKNDVVKHLRKVSENVLTSIYSINSTAKEWRSLKLAFHNNSIHRLMLEPNMEISALTEVVIQKSINLFVCFATKAEMANPALLKQLLRAGLNCPILLVPKK